MPDPIDAIEWRHASTLNANGWNPNAVLTPELELLALSLEQTGWVQPLLVTKAGTIIDGFHRWRLAQDSSVLLKRYRGMVPCAVLDVDEAAAMMLTVRMNRAKGTHAVGRMALLVQSLVDDHGVERDHVAQQIGATRAEVELLYENSVFKARKFGDYAYSEAWEPLRKKQAKGK